jgi:hypothetical protein
MEPNRRVAFKVIWAESLLVAIARRISEHEYNYAPVGVKLPSRRAIFPCTIRQPDM